jgi:hypothetical protein
MRITVLLVALAAFAAGQLSHPPAADAQPAAPAARSGRGGVESGVESRYNVSRMGDVVTLSDMRTALVVRVLTPASNAYQMTVKGEDVIRCTWTTLDDIHGQMGLNGVPLLWPHANRLVYTPPNNPNRGGGPGPNAAPAVPMRGSVAFEPMAAITNALNLTQKGLYKELQSIAPGGSWEESFWIRPHGF